MNTLGQSGRSRRIPRENVFWVPPAARWTYLQNSAKQPTIGKIVDDAMSVVKIVMTGSAEDGPDWQQHIRNKEKRRKLAGHFKAPKDPFKIVIVRDMWLTGFDAPSLSTMYVDKPMRGHALMQAIARVNRVFRDKPGGLVVDYLGLADQLKYALAVYTHSGGKGDPSIDTAKAIAAMLEKHESPAA